MVLPLFHISLPVAPSRAYSTAFVRASPPDRAKTTPFTIMGGRGEARSRDTHPDSSAGAPLCSTSFQAVMELAAGTSNQRVPEVSCQLASAPAVEFPPL